MTIQSLITRCEQQYGDDNASDELDELRRQMHAQRKYRNQLLQHPNQQDPDCPDDDADGENDD